MLEELDFTKVTVETYLSTTAVATVDESATRDLCLTLSQLPCTEGAICQRISKSDLCNSSLTG